MRPICLLAAVLATIGSFAWDARGAPAHDPLLTTRLLEVAPGRRLNLVCFGTGSPTVVFEQGWGETILDWRKVAEPISRVAKTCVYDRAGQGYSDPSDRPGDAKNAVSDLHNLLLSAHIGRPVVLVGHSLGGLFALVHADLHPRDVAGLVLVDPSFGSRYAVARTQEQKAAYEDNVRKTLEQLDACAEAGRAGALSLADPHHCFSSKPPLTAEELTYLLPSFVRPFRWVAMRSELEHDLPIGAHANANEHQERAARRPLGSMPVVVLTHDLSLLSPGESQAEHDDWAANLKSGHNAIAAQSSRGVSREVAGAGHNIQSDKPESVVSAIAEVLSAVRIGK